jgi:hypothetical protein
MNIKEACEWLQNLSFPTEIRESTWLFPTIETVHVLALVLVVGSIITVDLRLLGFSSRARSVRDVASQALPLTWSAFVVAAIAGTLLFTSKAVTYYEDIPFRLKMVCMLLAGINMVLFHWLTYPQVAAWDHGRPPGSARLAGGVSLLLWTIIVAAGRWIGFTT